MQQHSVEIILTMRYHQNFTTFSKWYQTQDPTNWRRIVTAIYQSWASHKYHIPVSHKWGFYTKKPEKNAFTVIAKDKVDKNARSNTASFHYERISNTVMQLPKADTTGDSLVIHPINKEDGYDLISVPSIQHFSTSLSS